MFGVYVAYVFRPRLQYGPALRRVFISYVDDKVIMVAGDTRGMVVDRLEEVFCDCRLVANR